MEQLKMLQGHGEKLILISLLFVMTRVVPVITFLVDVLYNYNFKRFSELNVTAAVEKLFTLGRLCEKALS